MHLHRLHRQQQSLINPAARYRFSLGRTYYIFIQVCKCDAMKEIEAGSWGQKAVFVKILALSMRRFPFVQAANSLSVSNVFFSFRTTSTSWWRVTATLVSCAPMLTRTSCWPKRRFVSISNLSLPRVMNLNHSYAFLFSVSLSILFHKPFSHKNTNQCTVL